MKSERYTMKGWSLKEFLKGREKLLVAVVGSLAGYVATSNPALAGLSGAVAELLYAVLKYYLKK